MSIEINDEDPFTLVSVGHLSDKTVLEINIANPFTNYNSLREYLINKSNTSIVVILSNNVSFDTISLVDCPQICAIYNEQLVCLYCLPEILSSVNTYLKSKQKEDVEQISSRSFLSILLSIAHKFWFLIGVVLSICAAYSFPEIGKSGGYIRSEWTIKYGCVVLVFFLTGLSLKTRQLAKEFLRIRLHALIQIYSLIVIPFIVYGLAILLTRTSMNKALIFGVIIMASTPTTISSNVVMTKNALGNEYVALLNAMLGNLLGIFISPALILFFMKNSVFDSLSNSSRTQLTINYSNVVKNLSLTVLVPLSIGQIIHLLWTKQVTLIREKFYFTHLNSIALLLMIWAVFSTAFATRSFQTIHTKDLSMLILLDAILYILFSLLIFLIARFPCQSWQFSEKDTIPIMFCGSTKTLAMGISLINALYGNNNQSINGLFSLPLIIYHAEQLIMGAIEVIILKNWMKTKLKTNTLSNTLNSRSSSENKLKTEEFEVINVKR